jgi:3-oxoacyl-(acyl-carrier-protein) synthase
MNSEQRIVITGMGAVSPVGLNCEQTFSSLIEGQSGISRVSLFDPSKLACQVAGEVKDFNPGDYMDRKMAPRKPWRSPGWTWSRRIAAVLPVSFPRRSVIFPWSRSR